MADDPDFQEERIARAVHAATKEAVHDTLAALGIDVDHGREMTADMLWVRREREKGEKTGNHVRNTAIGGGVMGAGIALWEGIKVLLKQDGGP